MSDVRLSGQLICRDDRDAAVVAEHLPLHVTSTRAEEGCISFEVSQTDDPLVWQVDEACVDAAAFTLHQDRTARSTWGQATAAIERRYAIEGCRSVKRYTET